ncbi:hypothetical protein ACQJBY_000655 [Aegilops geniculata]
MAELIAISLSAKVAAALLRTGRTTAVFLASFISVRSGIAAAARDLDLLRAFLRFADSRRGTDELVDAWVNQVRHVGFELEDVTDEYAFLSGVGFVRACAGVAARFALLRRLRKARERLRALSAVKEQLGIRPAEASASSSAPAAAAICRNISEAAHFVEEEEIVGFAEHTRLLMKCLTGDADPRRIIVAVCGMGGVGKTTLATNVYKKIAANCSFDCTAWVTVSKNFTTEDLMRRIIKELHRGDVRDGALGDTQEMDYRSLVEALRGHLAHKRYFLLLDDVWNADAWFQLRGALLDSETGSRIVITTRNQEVAALASDKRTIMLQPLREHEAWSLFCSTTFREAANQECAYHLQNWALKILQKCCGLPLAIISVGNLLLLKEKTEFAWKNVHDSLVWDERDDHGIGQVASVLNFSIDDLPYRLKRCFLYCSVYPEDFFIKRKILIREWIAEGLIEETGHGTMEEVADGYLNELVQRNLLLVKLKNEFGRAKRLHIHDLIREIAAYRSKQDGFFQLSKSARVDSKQKIRHLTLYQCQSDRQSAPNMPSLRSFYVLRSDLDVALFSRFRLLTVLNLWYVKASKLPSAVANLRNLRYLGVRSTYIEELPKELGRLCNLQTLDAKWSSIKVLPSSITKLKNLRHLILFTRGTTDFMEPEPGTAVSFPDGLENLKCLQTLKYVKADQKVVRSLESLEQMRSLELSGVDQRILIDLPSALSKMSCLLRLGIINSDANVTLDLEPFSPAPLKLKTLNLTGKLARGKLPSWFGSLTNLIHLHLRSSELGEDSIGLLSSLPRLLHLSLINACNERSLTFAAGCFPVLRQLNLQGLPNLTSIEFQKDSLVDLRLLTLGLCLELTEIPRSIENLIHLENVELFQMPSKLIEKIPYGKGYGANHQDGQRITVVKNFWHNARLLEQNIYINLSNVQESFKTDAVTLPVGSVNSSKFHKWL